MNDYDFKRIAPLFLLPLQRLPQPRRCVVTFAQSGLRASLCRTRGIRFFVFIPQELARVASRDVVRQQMQRSVQMLLSKIRAQTNRDGGSLKKPCKKELAISGSIV
jgi:hypothetical protein